MEKGNAPGEGPGVEITRYGSLPRPLKIIVLLLWGSGLVLFLMYVFNVTIQGRVLYPVLYYYLLYACFCPTVFLTLPARNKDRNRLPWYDLILAALVFGIFMYFVRNAWAISYYGWVRNPHTLALVTASVLAPIAIEGARRIAGPPFVILVLIFALYPPLAEYMPGILWGFSTPIQRVMAGFAFGAQGILGLPGQVIGELLIGFLIFAGMLIASGAGTFFLKLALALLGRYRGGPAKVAVIASAFFGSMSGSPIANIASTGAITIPAMKRLGYPSHYAGAIEAVASTGGIVTPPVMGSIAFIMAIITGIPYATIVVAAIIPATLYYWGLLVQVDAYAARVGLQGIPRAELPSLRKTLKEGWVFLVAIAFLMFGLLYMRWGVLAPIYASALMFILSFTRRETMMTPRKMVAALTSIGGLTTFMFAILVPVGLVIYAMQASGAMLSLTTAIMRLAGQNLPAVLAMSAAIFYVLGMIGVGMAAYVVLAVTIAPAVVAGAGLPLIAFHFFMIYYILTSNITPPVCISAFVAAGMAGAPPFKTGFTAMRLAVVVYFVPFFFLFHPALILQGPILETLYLSVLCLLGIWVLASGLEGYLFRLGRLDLWSRLLLGVSGFLIAFPNWTATAIGATLTVLTVVLILLLRKAAAGKPGIS